MKSKKQPSEQRDQLIPPELEPFSSKFKSKEWDLLVKKKYGELAEKLKSKIYVDIGAICFLFLVTLAILFTWGLPNIPIDWLVFILAGCVFFLFLLMLRDQIVRLNTLQSIINNHQDETSEDQS